MSYIRTFSGTLPSLGSYVALDFTQIESVTTGKHSWRFACPTCGHAKISGDADSVEKIATGTLVRMRRGAAMLFQGDEEKVFTEVWQQFVAESQQQERVESWTRK
jgi:hypothetical protein